jgi:hypothetical protein
VWYVCQFIYGLLGVRCWLTQLILRVNYVPNCSHLSLIIPPHISLMSGKVIRSRLHDRQLGLVLCPPIISCPVHILIFIISRCVLVLEIHEHLLIIDRNRRRDLLIKVELPHDSIWMVILNYSEVNHLHTTLPLVVR